MRSRRVIVLGTGTDVGKTHVALALVWAWSARGADVVGLKPIASGATEREGDHVQLARAPLFHVKHQTSPAEPERALRGHPGPATETFHVKQPLYRFVDPVSPHLAARNAGVNISPVAVAGWVDKHARDITIVETAGGAFSPLGDGFDNLALAGQLGPAFRLLVAPDRLGVLHDITATTRLAARVGLPIDGVVLSSPATPDASTGHNAQELAVLNLARPIAVFPRVAVGAPETRESASSTIEAIELAWATAAQSGSR